METKNNPTGRLLDILIAAKGHNGNQTTRNVWASVFGRDPADTGVLLEALADLIKLLAEAKSATERFVPGDPTIFLAPFPKVEAMLSQVNLEAAWAGLVPHLDDRVMAGLEFGDHALTAHYGKFPLNSALIDDFTTQLSELLQRCLNTDLPDDLKKLFIKNLEALRHALLVFKISGAKGLEDEIDRVLGSLLRHGEEIKTASSEGKAKVFTMAVFDVITKLNEAVQIVQNTATLAAPAATGVALMIQQFSG